MKLVSYNILDGGEGRADPLAEVIEAQRPDIVVLVEADVPDVVERIARRMNMDYVWAEGKKHGGAILSRWRIVESINHSLLREELTDCLVEATIAQPDGTPWIVGGVHLHARARIKDEEIRLNEVKAVLEVFAERRGKNVPHLLAGDFNANSPIQKIDPAQCKDRTAQGMGRKWRLNPQGSGQEAAGCGVCRFIAGGNWGCGRFDGKFYHTTSRATRRLCIHLRHGRTAGCKRRRGA